ncbi:MAG: cytochrome c [Gammaproteobacteria bacterium]|nr:cytochrome c [Gammaproteobacteria bacterium]MDP2139479.1 cytochrome c [Gammaproteobacteria bacterium]MDP2346315.1 cytochrome c [Gammaproteobacteria bacterium]
MKMRVTLVVGCAVIGLLLGYWLLAMPQLSQVAISDTPVAIARGEYLISAGGCVSCHAGSVDSSSMSGGLALVSEFGTFYVPNITPHPETGIGGWQAKDFLLAMRHGRSPDGGYYYPAFPYRSYAGLSDQDILDMAAYLVSLPPVESQVPPHELPFWLFRWMMAVWNLIADFLQSDFESLSDPAQLRGAYLARHLGHCGECHTPRNVLGMSVLTQEFAGATMGEGHVEALNSEALRGWTEEDFAFFLFLGMKPDGDYVGGKMEPVIEHNTSRLTEEDRQALAAFFKRQI